jgi:hypothetical protein
MENLRMHSDLVPGEWEVDRCYVGLGNKLHRCQACSQANVRFRHRLRHKQTGNVIDVGIKCCGVLIGNPELAQKLENECKRKMGWREHYEVQSWKPCSVTIDDLEERGKL